MPGYKRKSYTLSGISRMARTASKFGYKRLRTGSQVRRRKSRLAYSKVRSSLSTNIHCFKRWTPSVTTTCSGSTSESALVFTFGDMINYSDFTSLYDRYRIDYVVVRAQLRNNPSAISVLGTSGGNATGANYYPKLWYCPDYDDGEQETLDALKQRSKTKCAVLQPNKVIKFVVKPAILNQTYRTSVTTGYAPKWGQWIDMAQTNVPHYGLKYVIDALGLDPANDFTVQFEFMYHITCKDVR